MQDDGEYEQVSSHSGGKIIGLLLLVAIAGLGILMIGLTRHLQDVRPGDTETRLETWTRLESNVRTRYKDDGKKYYAASCPFSKVRTAGSNRLGQGNPHYKLAACQGSVCDYAILGTLTGELVVVTARGGVPEKVYLSEVRKDMCLNFDVDILFDLIENGGPLP
jgi:hypothetical protein